jgi:HK97 family phage portal protein
MKSIVGALLNRAPVPYHRDTLFETPTPTRANREKQLGSMEQQSTLFAIVDSLATDVAAVGWALYRGELADPGERVTRHPALSVWNKPNPFFTRTEYMETVQQHYELTGEKWTLTVRPEGMPQAPPIELWPVRPDRMAPVPHPTKFIAGYVYTQGRQNIPLKLDDVIFVKRPNPLDPYRGLGPIGSLILDMEGEKAAAEWNAAFFRNGAEPGGIIEVPELLEDEEFEKMQEHWNSQHRGARNAHRVALVEVGEWKERRYTQRDMQFEQLRRFSKENFRTAWRYPKPMLGDVEDVNRANADAGLVIYAQRLLVPRLNRWRTLLNDDFLPMFGGLGKGYHFNYDDPVPPNAQQEGQNRRLDALNVSSFVREGYDPGETLEVFGFPPIEWTGPPKEKFAIDNPPPAAAEPAPAPEETTEEDEE